MDTRRRAWGWALGAAGGLLAFALVSVVFFVQAAGGVACAAAKPPAPGAHSGTATFFDGSRGGNCSYGPPTSDLYVALGPAEYANAATCGSYVEVTGPTGTVRVKVVDQCPECERGHLDLSRAAFARIGAIQAGVIQVRYRFVRDPALPGPLQVKIKDGASAYWLAVQPDNHGNPLAGVEVRAGSRWTGLERAPYNYWIAPRGAGRGPFTLRLTDVYGHAATVGGITLSPLKVQATRVFMYGAAKPAFAAPTSAAPSSIAASSAEPASTEPASAEPGGVQAIGACR